MRNRCLFPVICLMILIFPFAAGAFFGPSLDFTAKPEKALKAVQKLDKKIGAVEIHDNDLEVTYNCGVVKDELLEESGRIKELVAEIAQAKGADAFDGVSFYLHIPVVDQHNNKSMGLGIKLYWETETLQKINWKGFQNWQLLDLIDDIEYGPLGWRSIQTYCGKRQGYNEMFCSRVGAWK